MATQEEFDAMKAERDRLTKRCFTLSDEIRRLTSLLDDAEDLDGTGIREQLESLATDVDRPCAPQTPEQWRRCLRVIAAGREWEVDGTWR